MGQAGGVQAGAGGVQGCTSVKQVTEEDQTHITAVPNCPYAELQH